LNVSCVESEDQAYQGISINVLTSLPFHSVLQASLLSKGFVSLLVALCLKFVCLFAQTSTFASSFVLPLLKLPVFITLPGFLFLEV
jgi:amino acid permease